MTIASRLIRAGSRRVDEIAGIWTETAMTETKPKRRWFRFSIRDLLWLTVLMAVLIAWWLDHRELTTQKMYKISFYNLQNIDAKVASEILVKTYSLIPDVRISVDTRNNAILVSARPSNRMRSRQSL